MFFYLSTFLSRLNFSNNTRPIVAIEKLFKLFLLFKTVLRGTVRTNSLFRNTYFNRYYYYYYSSNRAQSCTNFSSLLFRAILNAAKPIIERGALNAAPINDSLASVNDRFDDTFAEPPTFRLEFGTRRRTIFRFERRGGPQKRLENEPQRTKHVINMVRSSNFSSHFEINRVSLGNRWKRGWSTEMVSSSKGSYIVIGLDPAKCRENSLLRSNPRASLTGED